MNDALIQLCILLAEVQKQHQFMHRDMHGGNIRLALNAKKNAIRIYLIDFGFSRIEYDEAEDASIALSTPGHLAELRRRLHMAQLQLQDKGQTTHQINFKDDFTETPTNIFLAKHYSNIHLTKKQALQLGAIWLTISSMPAKTC